LIFKILICLVSWRLIRLNTTNKALIRRNLYPTHTNTILLISKIRKPPIITDYTMSQSGSDLSSAEGQRIQELETKLEQQQQTMTQMMQMMQQMQSLLIQQAQTKPQSVVAVEKTPKAQPVVPTKPIVKKKVPAVVDEDREELINKFYDLGFSKVSVKVASMSDKQIQGFIDRMESGEFEDYDLLTKEGLINLCRSKGLKPKSSMTRPELLTLLTGEEDEEEETEWVMSKAFLNKKNLEQLKQYCRDNGIKGFSTKRKDELVDHILANY
jgi:Rho termination factor, N-terminal domain